MLFTKSAMLAVVAASANLAHSAVMQRECKKSQHWTIPDLMAPS
jgi:hypothetical protein